MINRVLAGRYEVLEVIGEGPLLDIHRARDRQQNRMVALKTLRPVYRNHTDILSLLRSGLGQVFTFNHPNITRIQDVGLDEETRTLYIAEEYLRGIDLKERIKRVAPLSLTAGTDIAIAVAEALEYAHARGVAHGDVRPQNILVGPDGQVKLSGFGVAAAQAVAVAQDTALLRRVVAYSAPDTPGAGTPSADLYALGVLLFEMLTGELPYSGEGAIQVALKHKQEAIPSPRNLNQGIPRALEGITQKALGKQPRERYASAADLLKDLRAVRDALRYGKSLSWSPLDAGAPNAVPDPSAAAVVAATATAMPVATAPAAAAAGAATESLVMPAAGKSARRASPPATVPPPPVAPVAAPTSVSSTDMDDYMPARGRNSGSSGGGRSTGGRWLLALNLFLGAVFLGTCAYLAWLVLFFLQPPSEVIVPNLVGKQQSEAESMSLERKFKIEVVDKQNNDKALEGVILQQRPEPGRHILEGKPVSIWVSLGPKMVEVPDVRDMSFEKARAALEKVGLRLGDRRSEYDPIAARGNVIRQLPEGGENRQRGTRIDLWLSKGAEPPPAPVEDIPPPVTEDYTSSGDNASSDNGGDGNSEDGGKKSYLTVGYPIPNDAASHRIRIDVLDKNGINTVLDEVREAGETLNHDVEGIGKKITIRVYDNDVLVSEVTGPPFKQSKGN